MARVPAVCDSCGRVFPSSFALGGVGNVLQDCKAGPCPHCGSLGSIPNGVYSAISETVLALAASRIQAPHIQRLLNIAKSAVSAQADPAEVAEHVRSDLPELSSLADALPKTRSELYAFLAVIILFLTLLYKTLTKPDPPSVSMPQVNVFIEQVMEKSYAQERLRAGDGTPDE